MPKTQEMLKCLNLPAGPSRQFSASLDEKLDQINWYQIDDNNIYFYSVSDVSLKIKFILFTGIVPLKLKKK